MKVNDEDDFEECPNCGESSLTVMHDWVNLHDRETLLHCADCDTIFIVYYKLEKVVQLVPKF